MANITKIAILATSFVDGEVLSAQKLNGVISGINTVISKVNECIDALIALGFKKKEAQIAVKKVTDYTDLSDLLSKALVYFDN